MGVLLLLLLDILMALLNVLSFFIGTPSLVFIDNLTLLNILLISSLLFVVFIELL